MGGAKAEPAPTPAKISPLAKPRSAVGIQLATQRLELGYITDSPMPMKNRTDQMIRKPCAIPAGNPAVSAVKAAHHAAPKASMRRGPSRSANHPAGFGKDHNRNKKR